GGTGISNAFDITTTVFSQLFTSPSTLRLVLLKHHELQLSDLQGLVSVTPLANTNLVLLNTLGNTPQDAATLATDVYHALLQELTSQFQQLNVLYNEQQKRAATINGLLLGLRRQSIRSNDTLTLSSNSPNIGDEILSLSNNVPTITTVPGNASTGSQRIGLSP